MNVSTLRPYLVADSCPLPDGTTLLTAYRTHSPEAGPAALLLASLLTTIARASGTPERVERSVSDDGVTLVYRAKAAGFGLLVAPDRYQYDSETLQIRGDTDRTDILRKPSLDPSMPLYEFAVSHAASHGQAAQERLAGIGGTIHDRFWSPDAEDPPEMAEDIDIGRCLREVTGQEVPG